MRFTIPLLLCLLVAPVTAQDIQKLLDQKVELEYDALELGDVLKDLKDRYRISIELDKTQVEDFVPITVSVKGISLRSALKVLLLDADAGYLVRNKSLLVSSLEKTETTKTYSLEGLVPKGDVIRLNAFAHLFETTFPIVLPSFGRATPEDMKHFFWDVDGPTLKVKGAFRLQDAAKAYLVQMKAFRQAIKKSPPPKSMSLSSIPDESEKKIAAALQKKITIQTDAHELKEVVSEMKRFLGVEVQIDKWMVEDFAPITFHNQQPISVHSILRVMLHEVDATFCVRNEMIWITAQKGSLETRIYFLKDRVWPAGEKYDAVKIRERLNTITKEIRTQITPSSWESYGVIEVLPSLQALVIRNEAESHYQLEDFFYPPDEKNILAALAKPCTINSSGDELAEIILEISQKAGVNVCVDRGRVEDFTPITLKIDKPVTLAKLLETICKECDGVYFVDKELLMITTEENCHRKKNVNLGVALPMSKGMAIHFDASKSGSNIKGKPPNLLIKTDREKNPAGAGNPFPGYPFE